MYLALRLLLDYCVDFDQYKRNTDMLERVLRASRMAGELKSMMHEEKVRERGFYRLHKRRLRWGISLLSTST